MWLRVSPEDVKAVAVGNQNQSHELYRKVSRKSHLRSENIFEYLVGKVDVTDAECVCGWDDTIILVYDAAVTCVSL